MYDAYEALPILEKLPLQIESIAAYGNFTLQNHCLILIYQLVNCAFLLFNYPSSILYEWVLFTLKICFQMNTC
jgi:hypothetical protein